MLRRKLNLFAKVIVLLLRTNACSTTSSTKQKLSSSEEEDSCAAIQSFNWWILRMCPAVNDTRCAAGLPADIPGPSGVLNCNLSRLYIHSIALFKKLFFIS